jgi:hypothetical protein
MVHFPSSRDAQTPQRRVLSNPAWPSPSAFMSVSPSSKAVPQTPRSGKKSRTTRSARASPYVIPNRMTPGRGGPMVLFTPKQFVAEKEARLRQGSGRAGSMGPPTQSNMMDTPTRAPRPTPLFPPNLRGRKSSSTLAPLPMRGTPVQGERPQDPMRPKVKLLRVLSKCHDDEMEKDVRWAVRDDGLNGRCEERDRSAKWNTLSQAVHNAWPDLRKWIMRHTPTSHSIEWYIGLERIGLGDECYIEDPDIANKHSSLERAGFYSWCSF